MRRRYSTQLAGGFTLIELILVLVLVGVLGAFAAPKLWDQETFNSRGFYDETRALLRYAQKAAIAQRRTVCVVFTPPAAPTSVSLTMASAAAATNCSSATALTGPNGEAPAIVSARGAAVMSAAPAVLNFNGLGQPIDNAGAALATQAITVTNAPANITVQAVTGYVQ